MNGDNVNTFVRPIVTLAAMSGMMYGFVIGLVSAEVFVPFATGVVTWWFSKRDAEKTLDDQKKA